MLHCYIADLIIEVIYVLLVRLGNTSKTMSKKIITVLSKLPYL